MAVPSEEGLRLVANVQGRWVSEQRLRLLRIEDYVRQATRWAALGGLVAVLGTAAALAHHHLSTAPDDDNAVPAGQNVEQSAEQAKGAACA